MSALAILPTTTTTTTTTTSCLVSSRKRKRELHVRFCTQPQHVVYTWSQSDYDRSGLYPDNTMNKQDQQQQFIFTLSINIVQKQQEEQPVFKKKSKFNRPKLSIDTSNLHGPLYFTSMSTHHKEKKEVVEEEDVFDSVTKENTRRNSLPMAVLC